MAPKKKTRQRCCFRCLVAVWSLGDFGGTLFSGVRFMPLLGMSFFSLFSILSIFFLGLAVFICLYTRWFWFYSSREETDVRAKKGFMAFLVPCGVAHPAVLISQIALIRVASSAIPALGFFLLLSFSVTVVRSFFSGLGMDIRRIVDAYSIYVGLNDISATQR